MQQRRASGVRGRGSTSRNGRRRRQTASTQANACRPTKAARPSRTKKGFRLAQSREARSRKWRPGAEGLPPALFRWLLLLPKQAHHIVNGILLLLLPGAFLLVQISLQQPTDDLLHVWSELRIL